MVDPDPVYTVADVLRNIQKYFPNPKAFNYYHHGKWQSISTESFLEQIKFLALALNKMGIKKGDRVGLVSLPSPRWVIADMAIIMAGGVTVPLFSNISEENFIFEISQSELKVIFVAGKEPWKICNHYKDRFHAIIDLESDLFTSCDEAPEKLSIGIHYTALVEQGKAIDKENPGRYKELEESLNIDDVATIIYTSGSTGTPKGAAITHRNFISCVYFKAFDWDLKKDRFLNVLPLAHVFGRMLNFCMIAWGVSVYYFNDIKNFGNTCRDVHPTILVVVPRLLEKVYAKMAGEVHHDTGLRRHIAEWAFNLAHVEKKNWFQSFLHIIADKLVYKKFREGLGGSIRVLISGGAALNIHLLHFFLNIGIPVYEGWGLTEAATATVNRPGFFKTGTVGKPLTGQQIAISPDGEVLVKGDLVMKDYYKNPEASKKALDKDGWLHTGDKGTIDSEGFLTLQGRLKEVYKTSTGEYVVPVPIEQALSRSPYVDMAMVIADNRKFTSCLLFPDLDLLHKLKKKHQKENLSDEEFLNSPTIKQEMNQFIDEINKHLNHWEQIHQYRFVLSPLTIEAGELTPSMKIKRDFVAKKYSDLIDSMYQESTA